MSYMFTPYFIALPPGLEPGTDALHREMLFS